MPFLISSENSKRELNIYRVFRKLSYVNQPGFLGRGSPKNPGFFVLKKGAGCQPPIPGRSPVSGRTAFFVFSHNYSVPENLIVHDTEREQQVCSSPLPDGKTVRTITSHLC